MVKYVDVTDRSLCIPAEYCHQQLEELTWRAHLTPQQHTTAMLNKKKRLTCNSSDHCPL